MDTMNTIFAQAIELGHEVTVWSEYDQTLPLWAVRDAIEVLLRSDRLTQEERRQLRIVRHFAETN